MTEPVAWMYESGESKVVSLSRVTSTRDAFWGCTETPLYTRPRQSEKLVERVGIALCQNALGGKKCPCAETGKFQCHDAYPGYQARAAIRVIMEGSSE